MQVCSWFYLAVQNTQVYCFTWQGSRDDGICMVTHVIDRVAQITDSEVHNQPLRHATTEERLRTKELLCIVNE